MTTGPAKLDFLFICLTTLAVGIAGIATPALAQDEVSDPAYESEVRAPRPPPMPVDETPGFAVEIETEQSVGQLTTVSKLIEQSPGVNTRSLGGLGGFATVSVRGSSPNQVLVLLDGIPLSTAFTNLTDINAVPPDLLARVEVYRSGAPVWLGSAPMGAVVNLVSRDDLDRALLASGSWGSFNSRKLTLIGATPLTTDPDWDVMLGLNYLGSNGDFVFYDDRGTPYNSADDGDVSRQNNHFDAGQLLFRTNVSPSPNVDIGLMSTSRLSDGGVPGLGQNQSATARYRSIRSTTQLSVEGLAWPANIADTRLRVWFDLLRDEFTDRDGEIGLGRRDLHSDGWSVGSQLRLSLFPSQLIDLDLVADALVESYASHDELAESAPRADARRVELAPALSSNLYLLDRVLVLTGGARVELVDSQFGSTVPFSYSPEAPNTDRTDTLWTAQGGFRVSASRGAVSGRLHGTFGRFARMPTLLEMFGDTGAIVGNSELVPETALGGDLGVTILWDGDVVSGAGTAAGFAYRYDNLIQLVQNSQRVARPENISEARIDGVEIGLTGSIVNALTVGLAYTFTDATDTSEVAGQEGNQLPGRPRHVFRGNASAMWAGFSAGYDVDIESGNVLDRAGFRVVPERVFHGLIFGYQPPFLPDLRLTLEVDNLLDNRVEVVPVLPQPPGTDATTEQAISDYYGFPLPGRTVFVTVAWGSSSGS